MDGDVRLCLARSDRHEQVVDCLLCFHICQVAVNSIEPPFLQMLCLDVFASPHPLTLLVVMRP